jgi:hypothetical protein
MEKRVVVFDFINKKVHIFQHCEFEFFEDFIQYKNETCGLDLSASNCEFMEIEGDDSIIKEKCLQ